jgi:hypothetical protein
MSKKKEDRLARARDEIAARVKSFRATQEKFERERQEYYAATLGGAWSADIRVRRSSNQAAYRAPPVTVANIVGSAV